jgi:hypothetical protein
MSGRILSTCALFAGFIVVACSASTDDADEAEDESMKTEAAASSRSGDVKFKYEGTCEFLRVCSSWSRGLPEGRVLWGCSAENQDTNGDGRKDSGPCSDDDLWVAGPYKSYCGKTARICKGTTCIDAKVKDISVSHDWEASNGVLSALGIPFGLTSRCGGYGGGRVTLTYR